MARVAIANEKNDATPHPDLGPCITHRRHPGVDHVDVVAGLVFC